VALCALLPLVLSLSARPSREWLSGCPYLCVLGMLVIFCDYTYGAEAIDWDEYPAEDRLERQVEASSAKHRRLIVTLVAQLLVIVSLFFVARSAVSLLRRMDIEARFEQRAVERTLHEGAASRHASASSSAYSATPSELELKRAQLGAATGPPPRPMAAPTAAAAAPPAPRPQSQPGRPAALVVRIPSEEEQAQQEAQQQQHRRAAGGWRGGAADGPRGGRRFGSLFGSRGAAAELR
jgi:hypothetical protein